MFTSMHRWVLILFSGLLASSVSAQDFPGAPAAANAKTTASLKLEHSVVKPGDMTWAGLHLVIPKPWHTYWVNHGGVGEAPKIKWNLPAGVKAGAIHWPLPKKHPSFGSIAYVYEHEVLLLVPLEISEDAPRGELMIEAKADWLECTDEECVPGKAMVATALTVGDAQTAGPNSKLFATWRGRVPEAEQQVIGAEWAGEADDNSQRPLRFRVPVEDTKASVVFYPYLDPREKFMVQAEVKLEHGEGVATLTQPVEFFDKDWPVEFPGVMQVGDHAYEVLLKVGKPLAAAKPKPANPVGPGLLPGFPGANSFGPSNGSEVTLLLDASQAMPGDTVTAGVRFKIPAGWHMFYKDPGGPGEAPSFRWRLPEGIAAGEIQWPQYEEYESGEDVFNVYHDEVMLLVPLKLAGDLAPGEHKVRLLADWQECEQTCVQYNTDKSVVLKVGNTAEPSAGAKDIASWRAKLVTRAPPDNQEPDPTNPPSKTLGAQTKVTLLLDAKSARAGQEILAGVRFEIPEKWHIFWKYPGELGEAPQIEWKLPTGVTAGEIRWPRHEEYEAFDVKQNVYHDEVILIVPLKLAADLANGELEIGAKVTWQECEVSCVQGEADVAATLNIGATHETSADAAVISEWQAKVPGLSEGLGQLGWILLLALGGGLILNLMPCVLPVIALKVMGFVKQREESSVHARRLGLLYGAGVVFSFMIMAGVLLAVRAGAGGETWGMQMQNQWFLLFLAALMTLGSLNLFGVFEISLGGKAMTAADAASRREGGAGAFANGMLMVALATPCMAPMLGTAIPFALTQPAVVTLLVFATVAVGLALPYVVLSFKPDWLRFLPKPGAWMESFKKAMGFPMLAAAVWLMMLAGVHFGDKAEGMFRVALMLSLVGLAAWIYGEFIQRGTKRRGLAGVLALCSVGAGFSCLYVFQDKLDWKPWSQAAVTEARAAGHPVLVDFTADWCLTCKANKRTSIEVESVRRKIAETGTVVFKGDFTKKDPAMAEFIRGHGRAGVPLVIVYSPNAGVEPQVLPELLQPRVVFDALSKAATRPVQVAKKSEGNNAACWAWPLSNSPMQVAAPSEDDAIRWGQWSSMSIARAQKEGKPVLVDFTADWCAPCKKIEKEAIDVPPVRRELAAAGVVTLKADFTDKDPAMQKEINRFGRRGPPLVLVYPGTPGGEPVVMPKIFTAADMVKALREAAGKKSANNPGLEPAGAAATASH